VVAPAIHIYCNDCGQGLPAWQQALLSVVGVVIAFAILYGLAALFTRGRR
jgi:hypothetical protein